MVAGLLAWSRGGNISTFYIPSLQFTSSSGCRHNSRLRQPVQPGPAWPSLAAPSNKTINPLHLSPAWLEEGRGGSHRYHNSPPSAFVVEVVVEVTEVVEVVVVVVV